MIGTPQRPRASGLLSVLRWHRAAPVVVTLVAFTSGCALREAYVDPKLTAAPPAGRVLQRLILIGDAGEPKEPEPVLTAAREWADRARGRTSVVFLGDNAYPRGLIEGRRAEAERKLARQADAFADSGAAVTFVPGNHDWDNSDAEGLMAVVAQSAFVKARGAGFAPAAGCPGPEMLELQAAGPPRLRVVAIDTQWWLHQHARGDNCAERTPDAVLAALRDALATTLPVVVVAHHPLATNGQHGGFHSWRDHLFPFAELGTWGKYVPIPILGSLYPAVSTLAPSRQDIGSKENRAMRLALESVLASATTPALKVYAAGHEHSLQVLRNAGVDYALVSGAGSSQHESPVARRYNTLFAASHAGFMVIDVTDDGLHLSVVDVSAPPDVTTRRFALTKRH